MREGRSWEGTIAGSERGRCAGWGSLLADYSLMEWTPRPGGEDGVAGRREERWSGRCGLCSLRVKDVDEESRLSVFDGQHSVKHVEGEAFHIILLLAVASM